MRTEQIAEEVAKILLNIKAVTLSPKKPYLFSSGLLSPVYCDNRLLMSYPSERRKIISCFVEIIKEKGISFDVVAGTATAGIPHAAWLAEKLNKPMIYVRKRSKSHGKQNRIEGKLEEGQRVIVVEDLVSTGESSVSAVEAVREAGGTVDYCIAIFSYEMERARKAFEKAKCELVTLSKFSTLIDVAEKEGRLSKEEKELVLEWNKNPEGWSERHGFKHSFKLKQSDG